MPINGQDVRYVDGWAEGDTEGEEAKADVRRLTAASLGLIVGTFVGIICIAVLICVRTRKPKNSGKVGVTNETSVELTEKGQK